MFRDQSRSVVQKAVRSRAPKAIPANISPPINDQARDFFFSQYVFGKTGAFDYIQSFSLENDQHLGDSITAVSLAHFSTKANSVDVMTKARIKYISALRLLNRALQTPELVTKDATLLAILLLDLFEKITKAPPYSEEFSTNHIHGALELVKLRGDDQFNDPVGLRMFFQLCSTILISCVQFDIAIPVDFKALRRKAENHINPTEPKSRLTEVIIRFIEFRVALKNHTLIGSDAVFMAKLLDEDFLSISETMPLDFKYYTVPTHSELSISYQDFFHVYPCHRVTHMWNLLRILRILLNEFIWKQCLEALELHPTHYLKQMHNAQIERCSRAIGLLAAEICAAVPQYTSLPQLPKKSFSEYVPGCLGGDHCQGRYSAYHSPTRQYYAGSSDLRPPFQSVPCYSLLFPLYVAGQSLGCPEPMRDWIIKRLHSISSDIGIKEAFLVAKALESRDNISLWSMYALIGCYSFSA